MILLDNNVESCRSISFAFYGKYAMIKNDTWTRYPFPAQAGMILALTLTKQQDSGAFPAQAGVILYVEFDNSLFPAQAGVILYKYRKR